MKTSTALLLWVFSLIWALPTIAQIPLVDDRFAFENLPYDEQVPSPADFLGYRLGEEFTVYHQAVAYARQLGETSGRVHVGEYGETYEGRPLVYLIITSEENQGNLEEIRKANLELADPGNTSSQRATTLIQNQPVVVSYSYNIHGNEASGTEAAMQVAYRFAAAQDAETKNILDNAVLVFYLCINPDGRDRYVYWYKSMKRELVAAEPEDIAHHAPWPNGRTNHYWFDLNRDWIWGVHPESRGQTSIYQQWMPQVHVDYHEQGYNQNYFTMPGTTPRNQLLPDQYEALSDTFGRANIAAFDQHQLGYATREAFDFFYPGYGSSYPSVMGAIGMLTEQGGIAAGRAVETDDGYVLKLRQRIFDHYTTSVATIEKAVERRSMLLRYFHEALKPENSKASTKTYVLPDDATGYLYDVLKILLHHGVKVEKATAAFSARGTDYRSGQQVSKQFPSGTFLVSTDQPRHLFLHTVMEREMSIEDSVMYDMATWSAPLAYNLECYAMQQSVNVTTDLLTEVPKYPSGVENEDARYAYLVSWNQRHAPKALSMLWEKGYRVRAAEEPFSDGDQNFKEGTLIVLLGRNLDKEAQVQDDMREIAEETGVKIYGFDTGRMARGSDLFSRNSQPLKKPKAAMLIDEPFSVYSSGQLWFLFDQESRFPITRIRARLLRQGSLPQFGSRYGYADLNDFDVLLLPPSGGLEELFDAEALSRLKDWVDAGGTLVATEQSAKFFTESKSAMTGVPLHEVEKDSTMEAKMVRYKDREDFFGLKRIPGSALHARVDASNPLAFGLSEQFYSIKFGNDALKPHVSMQAVAWYESDAENLLAAGYASQENLQHLAGQVFAGVIPMEQGNIVLLTDNMQYRMFWRGPSRLVQNAVMLLPGF